MADSGWIEWGGELIWAVGFTSGGAPYGLRVCDFDRADLEAMGLDVAALEDAGQLATTSSAPCSASTSSMSTGTTTSLQAHSALTVSRPRFGGQSTSTAS